MSNTFRIWKNQHQLREWMGETERNGCGGDLRFDDLIIEITVFDCCPGAGYFGFPVHGSRQSSPGRERRSKAVAGGPRSVVCVCVWPAYQSRRAFAQCAGVYCSGLVWMEQRKQKPSVPVRPSVGGVKPPIGWSRQQRQAFGRYVRQGESKLA